MGGYGASRIGMKHADVFGSLYIMSPCCLSPRGAGRANPASDSVLAAISSPAESAELPFGLRAGLAAASAWSPNPANPPLYLDLPSRNGEVQPEVIDRFAANAPLAFVHQYIGELRRYDAIALDVGDQDGLRGDTGRLHEVLNSYGIENAYEVYPGNHTSRVAFRFQDHVLPFFSQHLCAEAACEELD